MKQGEGRKGTTGQEPFLEHHLDGLAEKNCNVLIKANGSGGR